MKKGFGHMQKDAIEAAVRDAWRFKYQGTLLLRIKKKEVASKIMWS